jgi:hypothetical protein
MARAEVVGTGPVLLMEVGGTTGSRIDVRQSQSDESGWYGQKTPWLVPKSYRGALLIRGRRLDGTTGVRFAFVYGDHRLNLWWPTVPRRNRVGGYFALASSVLVRRAGCYGFQLDGTSFSERIVVKVIGN